jgi:hypothetical protein
MWSHRQDVMYIRLMVPWSVGRRPPRSKARWLLASLAAVACGALLSLSAWSDRPNWTDVDSLFYQAMSLEVGGTPAPEARARVFASALAPPAIKAYALNPAYQAFESQFSRRRWLVPALADAIRPVAGDRSLPDVAIVGYLLFGLTLFWLLASRFSAWSSLSIVALCLALGPLRDWGVRPMTDSWGLALSAAAVLCSLLVLARGMEWLPLWIAVMVGLSFTRDLALIPIAGLAWLMYRYRDATLRRTALVLAATGVLATVPSYLLFGASLRLSLAYQMSRFHYPVSPAHSTWGYVAEHYPAFSERLVRNDLRYVLNHPVVGLTFVIGVVALFALPANRDRLILLMRGASLGWLLLIAIDPGPSRFRYELTLVPSAAVGLCLLVEQVRGWHARRRSSTPQESGMQLEQSGASAS